MIIIITVIKIFFLLTLCFIRMVSDMMRHDDNRRIVKQKENNFKERLPLCKRNSLCLDLLHETVVFMWRMGVWRVGWLRKGGEGWGLILMMK